MRPAIAVLSSNVLMGLGLKTLLGELLPMADIEVFDRFDDFENSDAERYVHFFVAKEDFLQHTAYFRSLRHKTIILGRSGTASFADMHQLDIYSGEERLVGDILRLRHAANRPEHRLTASPSQPAALSTREEEVLILIARGLINKQIAQRLGIGMTTVISHRKNIMEKLGIKSVAGLTLYAVTRGYIDAGDL